MAIEHYHDKHGLIMTISWVVLQNILLWSTNFKFCKAGVYIHIMMAVLVSLLSVAGIMIIISLSGIEVLGHKQIHTIPGFILLILLPFILASGTTCKYSQISTNVHSNTVKERNILHSLFGWFVILLAKFIHYIFRFNIPILIIDIISHLLFLFLKFFPTKLGAKSLNAELLQKSVDDIRKVRSKRDLEFYYPHYFIFADYVYPTNDLYNYHPGGWRIIDRVRGREVDRFMYGMEPVQMYSQEDKPQAHSLNSIKLAGSPLAKVDIPSLISGMQMLNQGQLYSSRRLSSDSPIYEVQMKLDSKDIRYNGYTDIRQIGQYYALTDKKKLTRLYTVINFLRYGNKSLMNSIFNTQNINAPQNSEYSNIIPLLIKKYQKGKFTSKYIGEDFDGPLAISKPRGLGLSLGDYNPGKIILFSAGTGIYSYCDLIDLLYKQMLVDTGHSASGQIVATDPLIAQRPFTNYRFVFFIALNSLSQLHSITLNQINALAENNKIECIMKLSNKTNHLNLSNSIKLNSTKFQKYIKPITRDPSVSQIIMCGPGMFSKSIIQEAQKNFYDRSKYHIL